MGSLLYKKGLLEDKQLILSQARFVYKEGGLPQEEEAQKDVYDLKDTASPS